MSNKKETTLDRVKARLHQSIDEAEFTFQPETDYSLACYQFRLQGVKIWVDTNGNILPGSAKDQRK